MKIFKKLAVLSMALLFAFGLGAMTACDGGDTSSSASNSEAGKTYTCYEFTVLDKDGNKVADGAYQVQLCNVNADGSLGSCLMPIAVASGVCEYTAVTEAGIYEAHVLDANFATVELKEVVRTSADAFGAYTLQLAE